MRDKFYYYTNYCEECGEPISDRFTYCYEHAFDECECGNTKKREHEYCRECHNTMLQNEKIELNGSGICPICGEEFAFSEYLNEVFESHQMRLLANLITHYRHSHQSSWNQSCHYISKKYGEDTYLIKKNEHNNRAKRQILRKCKDWLYENQIEAKHFLSLSDNDIGTINLINKTYGHAEICMIENKSI